VVSENGPFHSGVGHSGRGEAQLCGAKINGRGSKQTGVIMDYRCDFELLVKSHRNLGGETLLCMFHEWLQPMIKSELDVVEFESLQALMDRAMVVKARNLAW